MGSVIGVGLAWEWGGGGCRGLGDCVGLCGGLDGLVRVDGDAAGLGVRLAWSISWGPPVGGLDGSVLEGEVERLLEELRSRYSLETLRLEPRVRALRDFYWRIGVDPTKTRPSSEALVRRALRGRWPRVNPVVDAGNIASAKTLVPIGLYDLERARPPLVLRLSRGGEVFRPIGGGEEVLPGGLPVLVDAGGRVLHLFPHRDSRDTMVRPETRCVLVLAAGVPGLGEGLLVEAVRETQRLLGLLGWESCPGVARAP